jgi:hypothetical protein
MTLARRKMLLPTMLSSTRILLTGMVQRCCKSTQLVQEAQDAQHLPGQPFGAALVILRFSNHAVPRSLSVYKKHTSSQKV